MTKYSVSVLHEGERTGIALFADSVNFHAIVAFCYEQFECGNSLTTPGENIAITDLDTGEILWNWKDAQNGDYDEEWLDEEDIPQEDDPYDVDWDDHYYDYGDWDSDYLDDGCPIEDTDYLGEDGYALDVVDESN